MTYQGIIVHKDGESPILRRVFSEDLPVNKNITFSEASFRALREKLQDNTFKYAVLLVEIRDRDNGEEWFPLLKEVVGRFPYCQIIFVFEEGIQECTPYLNKIPFTYLLPLNYIDTLLPEALDKALQRLSRYFQHHNMFVSLDQMESDCESIVFFTTEGVVHRGNRGCMVHFNNQKVDYTKQSLKALSSVLPPHFMQVHKSYIVNMNYCRDRVEIKRPKGNEKDQFLVLSYPEGFTIPLGSKYKDNVKAYLLDRKAPSLLQQELQYTEILPVND